MNEYLMRDDAPFPKEEWARVDNAVVEAAKQVPGPSSFRWTGWTRPPM